MINDNKNVFWLNIINNNKNNFCNINDFKNSLIIFFCIFLIFDDI
jgi:hypothetical protein